MKSSKIIFLFSFAIIGLILINSCSQEAIKDEVLFNHQTTEIRSLCPDYLDVEGCSGGLGGSNVGMYLIYEGCQIPIQVNMRKCIWGIYFDPPIINWNAVFNGIWTGGTPTPCTDLANKLLNLRVQGKLGELNDLLLDVKKQASLFAQRQLILFNSQINENFYPCDENSPDLPYSSVTQESDCTLFCFKNVPGTGIYITEILCGAGCCTRKTPFCIVGPGEIRFGTPIYENSQACVNNNIWFYDTNCPEGSTTLEICNTACSKI